MIVIGTAGHIDHGKSAIVKRLTGTDPDRLPEEKERGMTIDLGFAFYDLPTGQTVALVDVPGHERFVKNMIAGAGGIDAVLLVVAADDGWMPQSDEHFQITRLLGIKHGLIVVNKIDLVEPDWLELLGQEIREKTAGSFLQDALIVNVSAVTGDGFEELALQISSLAGTLKARQDLKKARLFVDRSFLRPGMGGVVTGTLRGGEFKLGQSVGIWPSQTVGKIRSLHLANADVEIAGPGQRTAISFTGVEKDNLVRGGVIADRTDLSFFDDNPVLALSVEMLPSAAVPLEDRRRTQIIVGTTEVDGEIRLFGYQKLMPSQKGVAFFQPDNPTYALVGDRYILRLPSPMVTLGGGMILDHLPRFPRRKQIGGMGYLQMRLAGSTDALIISELEKLILIPRSKFLENAEIGPDELDNSLNRLIGENSVELDGDILFHPPTLAAVRNKIVAVIKAAVEARPHLRGLSAEKIRSQFDFPARSIDLLVEYLTAKKVLVANGELFDLAGRSVSLKGVIKQAYEEISKQLTEHPFDPPALSQLASGGKIYQQAIKYMLDSGEVYKCGADFIFPTDSWRAIVRFMKNKLTGDKELAVADLRDKFGLTRKYAIPILEETDRQGLTQRKEDVRIPGVRFEDEEFSL